MHRIVLTTAMFLLLAGLAACDAAVQSRPLSEATIDVRGGEVRLEERTHQIEISGTVSSRARAELTPRILARVLEVSVEEGDRVSAGQVLVRLENRDLAAAQEKVMAVAQELELIGQETRAHIEASRAGLEQAEANATLADSTFRRYQTLLEKEAVSQQEFDQIQAQRETTQAAVRAAQSNLRALAAREGQLESRAAQVQADRIGAETAFQFSEIRAPFRGVVVRREVDPGDLAAPSGPLLVVEKEDYRFEAAIEESLLSELRLGLQVVIRIDSLEADLGGRVAQIAPSADPRTRATRVKVNLPAEKGLRSGLFGRLLVPGGATSELLVPNEALVERGQLTGVFVIENQRASFRVIRIGLRGIQRSIVLSGLTEGDRVILSPSSAIRDGSPVRLVSVTGEAES